jgi:hypothetical protein
LIAVFLALGIGIVIGGSIGAEWVEKTEDSVIQLLLNKYDAELKNNQQLQEKLDYLQRVRLLTGPVLLNKRVLWVCPDSTGPQRLVFAVQSEGAKWHSVPAWSEEEALKADAVLICKELAEDHDALAAHANHDDRDYKERPLFFVDMKERDFSRPESAAALILKLKAAMEEDETHDVNGFNRHTGLE